MEVNKEKIEIEFYPINTILYTLDNSCYKIQRYKIMDYRISCESNNESTTISILYVLDNIDNNSSKHTYINSSDIGKIFFTSREELIQIISN